MYRLYFVKVAGYMLIIKAYADFYIPKRIEILNIEKLKLKSNKKLVTGCFKTFWQASLIL